MAIPIKVKRLITGAWLLVCLACVANYYLDLGAFGRFKREAVIVSFIVLFFVLAYIGPTLHEIRDYRASKRVR